jgi:hypothetical protein
MATLLLSRGLQPEADELAAEAERVSWRVRWLKASDDLTDLRDDEFAFYGDTIVGTRLGNSLHLALIEPSFDHLIYLPAHYTKRQIEYATLAKAFHKAAPVFVKPADGCNKRFKARVWESGALLQHANELAPQTAVIISEPVRWLVEYRLIVLERQVVTFAAYMRGGVRAQVVQEAWPQDEREAAAILSGCEEFLADPSVSLPPAFTLDVGLIENRGWAVVEFNSVWCSRFFGCDRSRLLPVLERACLSRARMDEADWQWTVSRPLL